MLYEKDWSGVRNQKLRTAEEADVDVGGIYVMSGVENLLSPATQITPTLAHVARVHLAST